MPFQAAVDSCKTIRVYSPDGHRICGLASDQTSANIVFIIELAERYTANLRLDGFRTRVYLESFFRHLSYFWHFSFSFVFSSSFGFARKKMTKAGLCRCSQALFRDDP